MRKNLFITSCLFIFSISIAAQNLLPAPDSVIVDGYVYKTIKEGIAVYYINNNVDTFYLSLDKMPEFPGDNKAMYQFLGENINYPSTAKSYGITGKVYINFTVSKTGKIIDIQVLRGVHDLLDNEAIRVVNLFPKWNVGEHNGKSVNVKFNLPINFKLTGSSGSRMNPRAKKHLKKGDEFYTKKDYQKAIENYTTAILYYHTNANAYSKRAQAYQKLNEYEKACRDWKRCLDFWDDSVKPLIEKYCK